MALFSQTDGSIRAYWWLSKSVSCALTSRNNQQVNNNFNKFPERYRFQLNKEELDIILRSKKSALNKKTSFQVKMVVLENCLRFRQ